MENSSYLPQKTEKTIVLRWFFIFQSSFFQQNSSKYPIFINFAGKMHKILFRIDKSGALVSKSLKQRHPRSAR